MSGSPHALEPPRRKLLVEIALRLSPSRTTAQLLTPHYSGAPPDQRIEWEAQGVPRFWQLVEPDVVPADFADIEIVDIGCGWGGKAITFARTTSLRSITGVDLPDAYDPAAPNRYVAERGIQGCEFVAGAAEELPLPDNRFDLAIMDDVLEHVHDPSRALEEASRVLRPGGMLIAVFPSFKMLMAHHLDRALKLPGLHYLLPMRTWAAGLNQLRLDSPEQFSFEPFNEVSRGPFGREVTANLNGMTLEDFRAVAARSPFRTRTLTVRSYGAHHFNGTFGALGSATFQLYRLAASSRLRELLGWRILYVGINAR